MSFNTFQHDSILGGLNLFKRKDSRHVLDKGERPSFPIINSNATFMDVIDNLNYADFGIVLFSTLIGIPLARVPLMVMQGESLFFRRYMFGATWRMIIGFGCIFAFTNSYYRLNGFVDNGLRWKRREIKLRKYDFTSEFERDSIFGFLRLRETYD